MSLEHPYAPIVRNQPARDRNGPIRAVVFNAAGGARVEQIARRLSQPPLTDASIILLCEADWRTARSRRREVASELASLLGMSMAYLPEFTRQMGGAHDHTNQRACMGNAILSSAPLDDIRVIAMPDPHPESARNLRRDYAGGFAGLVVRARFGGEPIWIGVAHLHSRCAPAGRAAQMDAFLKGFPQDGPAIFGGDLNSTTTDLMHPASFARTFATMLINPQRFKNPQRYEPIFERLAAAGFQIDGANALGRPTFTFSGAIPTLFRPRLDWIALRGIRAQAGSAQVVAAQESFASRRFSDHDLITVAMEI
ncbi:MAG: endonuclease/exonuclease/phosphatase family protein [Candidatus Binataceae bacterium]